MRRPSLRWRIVLALVTVAIVTSGAVFVAAAYFLRQTPQISTNPALRTALQSGLTLAKREYDARKESLVQVGRQLAEQGSLARFHAAGADDDLQEVFTRHGLESLSFGFEPVAGRVASPPGEPTVVRDPAAPDRLRLVVPFTSADGAPWEFVAVAPLSELLAIEEALQTYGHLEMIVADLRSGLQLNLAAIAIFVTALAALVGIRIGIGITGPLHALVRGTRELARDNLNYRIPAGPSDEIGLLIDSFNTMARDLQENRRRRLEAEKLAAWQEIARRLAHEIKNPLTPIQLTVQQMRDKYEGENPAYRKLLVDCADIVTEEVESLRKLVEEFSEFARMPRLALTRHDINDVIRDTTRLYVDANIELDLATDLPELEIDLEGMRRVVINLVKNALDAAGPGSPLIIRTHLRQDEVRVDFIDQGPGVAVQDRKRIFEPYVSNKDKGTGLGLATVQTIVDEHRGRITVGDAPSGGAQFEIALPVPPQPGQPAEEAT